MTVSVRLGRNLTSLEYKSDPTDRATRIMPIAQQVAGASTFVGAARWLVTAVSTLTVTLADPAGAAGPIAYDNQTVGWKLYSEKSATTTAISSATASTQAVVVASVSNVAVGDYVQFRDGSGLVPYYLDHPTYVATSDPGIGVKFGTIDRSKIPGVANLCPNSVMRTWTTATSLPDNWDSMTFAGGTAGTISKNTDDAYTQLGGASLLIKQPTTNSALITPQLKWTPEYTGQRLSARLRLYIPKTSNTSLTSPSETLNWNGNFHGMEARLGIIKTDGSLKLWMHPTEVATIVPPDSTVTGPNVTKVAADSWIDVVLDGVDITSPSQAIYGPITGPSGDVMGAVTSADLATQANIAGYVLVLYQIQTPAGGGCLYVYVDAAMLTVGLEAPETLTEFGGANQLWQSTNTVLGLLAPPQVSYSVDVVDLGRLNNVSADTFVLGGQVLVNDTELGVVNVTQRVVEIEADELVPGSTRITLANRTRRLTDLLTNGALSQSGNVTVGGGGTSTSSSGNSSGTGTTGTSTPPSTGGTGGTGGTGSSGDSVPAPVVSIVLDSSNNWTATAVVGANIVRVKMVGSTSGMPSDDDVRAAVSDTSAPFTVTGGPLLAGQTVFVKALAYDTNGTESSAGTAQTTAPASSIPPVSDVILYLAPGAGLYTDAGATPVAADGDRVVQWKDQSTTGANAAQASGSFKPIYRTSEAYAGQAVVEMTDGDVDSDIQYMDFPSSINSALRAATAATFFVVKRNLHGNTAHTRGSWWFAGDTSAAGAACPWNDGNIYETFGRTSQLNVGAPGFDMSAAFHVYKVTAGTNHYRVETWNAGTMTVLYTSTATYTPTFLAYSTLDEATTYGIGRGGKLGGLLNGMDARVSSVLIVGHEVSGAENDTVMEFLTATTAPSLSAAYDGGDVILTLSAPGASTAKIDATLTGTPTATNVRATTSLTVLPFSKTYAAPTGTDILHAAALAYFGTTESTLVTLDVSPASGTASDAPTYILHSTATSLPNSLVLADATTITWSTATAGLIKGQVVNANPSTIALGDIFYASATNQVAVVTGNQSTIQKVLSQTGTGAGSAAPVWVTMPAGGSGASTIASLTDVSFTTLANSQILTYDSSLTKWKNASGGTGASALASLSDVALTTLANAQVLTYDSSLTAWKNAAASGGSVPGWVSDSPNAEDASPDAADDEFGGTAYPSETALDTGGTRRTGATAWQWLNQGTSTVSVGTKGLLTLTPQADGKIHGVEQAIAAGTPKYRAPIAASFDNRSGTLEAGIYIRHTSGNMLTNFLAFIVGTGIVLGVDHWSNATTLAGGETQIILNSSVGIGTAGWLEIYYDGTTIYFRHSWTGLEGTFTTFLTRNANSYLTGAPTHVGIFGLATAGNAMNVVVDRWNKI